MSKVLGLGHELSPHPGAGMRPHVTEAQFDVMQKKVKAGVAPMVEQALRKDTVRGSNPLTGSPYRSKLEETFAYRLVLEKRTGIIANYWYEPLNLRLPGKKNFYKPDFLVLAGNGLTFYEIKGRNKSDDRSLVKIKTAAGITPWAKFVLVKRINGQWHETVIR